MAISVSVSLLVVRSTKTILRLFYQTATRYVDTRHDIGISNGNIVINILGAGALIGRDVSSFQS